LFEDLLQMDVAELRDLLGVVSGQSHLGFGVHEPEGLVALIEGQLRDLLEVDPGADRPEVERRVLGLVAEGLELALDPAEPSGRQLDRIYEHISERVVAELAPLFRVAVSMGWADGEFTADEMLVVSSGLRRVRLQAAHREALRKLSEAGKDSGAEGLDDISAVAQSPDRRRALLAFAWAVALADGREDPGERALYDELSGNLGVDPEEADRLRELVTARYHETLAAVRSAEPANLTEPADPTEPADRVQMDRRATAALGALIASGLEEYLVSATGVIGLSMVLGVPISLHGTASLTALPRLSNGESVVGAPGLLAGSLLLRGLQKRPALQKSLAIVLACLDRRA
jgi:uncharacterized tellurite resistance protein B-like protein